MQVSAEEEPTVVLTAPLALEEGLLAEFRPPKMMQQLFGLLHGMQPGADLTNFQACDTLYIYFFRSNRLCLLFYLAGRVNLVTIVSEISCDHLEKSV